MYRYISRRTVGVWAVLGLMLAAGLTLVLNPARSQARSTTAHVSIQSAATAHATQKPTIVLVNGAWANSASWTGVIERLEGEGYTVYAPPNPLESLKGDAAHIRDFIETIKGPVVLVGHSYGGSVITNAATGLKNVKALVYVDAFAPAKGESTLGLDSQMPGSALGAGVANVFNLVPFPGAAKGDALLYVKTSVFLKAFANGLPKQEGEALAATQGPAVYSALTAKSGTPAWKTIPSWYVLGTIDKAIPPAEELFMAQRMHAHITKVDAGHLSMIAAPGTVAKVITNAATATS